MTDNLKLNVDAYLPLRDVVFHTLREAILKGELKPGERLMELQLASKLGVSRTPIREAGRVSSDDPAQGCGSSTDDRKRHERCFADP